MSPRMRLTLAELLDRYVIELRKDFYGHGNPDLIRDVYHEIWGQIANLVGDHDLTRKITNIILSAARLGIHNADIANLEWQARAGQQLSLAEHGRRSQIIRHINDKGRTAVKQELSAVLGHNTETRHYGYGDDLKASDLTLDVQEPLRVNLNKQGFDIPPNAKITAIEASIEASGSPLMGAGVLTNSPEFARIAAGRRFTDEQLKYHVEHALLGTQPVCAVCEATNGETLQQVRRSV